MRVDAAQIERVLVTMLEDALRLSSPDRVEVEVTRSADAEVRVRISDCGPGLRPRISSGSSSPSSTGGAGGRARALDSRSRAASPRANGCSLWAEPRAASGASFVLALPAAAAPERVHA